ncbi:MAG TPA: TraB/GumN family protein [Saprospiraceae bacterium]|nr:TraB/GumN family protein [Saprospiraceae bacterium]
MKNQSVFWSIQPPDGGKISYLLGTMHLLHQNYLPAFNSLEFLIKECGLFALEVNPEHAAELTGEALFLPEGQRMSDFFIQSHFEKHRKFLLKATKIDLRHFDKILPIHLISEITRRCFLKSGETFYPDQFLWQKAARLGLTTFGLETFEEDLHIMRRIPLQYQIQSLKKTLQKFSTFKRQLKKSENNYINGRLSELYKQSKNGLSNQKRNLLYERNQKMAERITNLAGEHKLFGAVGVAHLPGKYGILRILKNKGWKLSPLKFELRISKKAGQ